MRSVTVVRLRLSLLLTAFGLLSAASVAVSAQTVSATLPEVNFLDLPSGPYPSAPQTVGSFSYTAPVTITSATISGSLGNPDYFTTAPIHDVPGSPLPPGVSLLSTICTSIVGTSSMRRTRPRNDPSAPRAWSTSDKAVGEGTKRQYLLRYSAKQ
jgi:hypothetical protein